LNLVGALDTRLTGHINQHYRTQAALIEQAANANLHHQADINKLSAGIYQATKH
jgi:hypothetical protein